MDKYLLLPTTYYSHYFLHSQFNVYFVKCIKMLYDKIGVTFVYTLSFALRMFDLRGRGLRLPKIGGSQRKLRREEA